MKKVFRNEFLNRINGFVVLESVAVAGRSA
jgi:hypothetical protein